MKVACIYWKTSSVGGIATHLNAIRTAAISAGDTFDILHSTDWKTKSPTLFNERQWIRGGDTKIWVDGELPQTQESVKWLNESYDAIYFGCICPHPTKAYPHPKFIQLYESNLPKVAGVTDGYWHEYAEWGRLCVPKVKRIVVVQPTYADVLKQEGIKVDVLLAPFCPQLGRMEPKSTTPLLVWPNQWKNIKGITQFLKEVPNLPKEVKVELYSNGIRYYQLRTDPVWAAAVDKDLFQQFHGKGRATFFGNVDVAEISKAYQRSWFTVNLQGMNSRKVAYQKGSYNLTEVEALYYGALPILHSSATQTSLPKEIYIPVSTAEEIPNAIRTGIKGMVLDPKRRSIAREYVLDNHLASKHWRSLKEMF